LQRLNFETLQLVNHQWNCLLTITLNFYHPPFMIFFIKSIYNGRFMASTYVAGMGKMFIQSTIQSVQYKADWYRST